MRNTSVLLNGYCYLKHYWLHPYLWMGVTPLYSGQQYMALRRRGRLPRMERGQSVLVIRGHAVWPPWGNPMACHAADDLAGTANVRLGNFFFSFSSSSPSSSCCSCWKTVMHGKTCIRVSWGLRKRMNACLESTADNMHISVECIYIFLNAKIDDVCW